MMSAMPGCDSDALHVSADMLFADLLLTVMFYSWMTLTCMRFVNLLIDEWDAGLQLARLGHVVLVLLKHRCNALRLVPDAVKPSEQLKSTIS